MPSSSTRALPALALARSPPRRRIACRCEFGIALNDALDRRLLADVGSHRVGHRLARVVAPILDELALCVEALGIVRRPADGRDVDAPVVEIDRALSRPCALQLVVHVGALAERAELLELTLDRLREGAEARVVAVGIAQRAAMRCACAPCEPPSSGGPDSITSTTRDDRSPPSAGGSVANGSLAASVWGSNQLRSRRS